MTDYLDLDDQTTAEALAVIRAMLNAKIASRDAEIAQLRAQNAELVAVCEAALKFLRLYGRPEEQELYNQLWQAINKAREQDQATVPGDAVGPVADSIFHAELPDDWRIIG